MTRLRSIPLSLVRSLRDVHKKNVHAWALPWLAGHGATLAHEAVYRLNPVRATRHLLFCLCDHYEPEWGSPGPAVGEARVAAWQRGYPRAVGRFRDSYGRPPQHTFFFPGEEYRPAYLSRLSDLIAGGFGEVELHLHHSHDTSTHIEAKIRRYLAQLAAHGNLSRQREGGTERLRYAFIHGDWALANGNLNGKACGVNDELEVLFRTGCYADFTFPSAPHPTQPRVVNRIYWPIGDLGRARCYESAEPAMVGFRYADRVLMITGPLALSRKSDRLALRIESSALTARDPPTPSRVRVWVRQGICVAGRPEWVFVKVHTHGAPEAQAEALLGPPGQRLHEELTTKYDDGIRWVLHYVTAREMYNIACAAMDGHLGDPHAFRDYCLPPPPASPRHFSDAPSLETAPAAPMLS